MLMALLKMVIVLLLYLPVVPVVVRPDDVYFVVADMPQSLGHLLIGQPRRQMVDDFQLGRGVIRSRSFWWQATAVTRVRAQIHLKNIWIHKYMVDQIPFSVIV